MELSTLITMVLVVGTVWGGFAAVLITALRKENQKSTEGKQ
jgi:hypothetical protein